MLSWNYELTGKGFQAFVRLRTIKEEGSILLSGREYTIQKNGLFKGHWSLILDGKEIGSAEKTAAMFRAFQVTGFPGDYTVIAKSAWKRRFQIKQSDKVVGNVFPDHAFSRKAQIDIDVSDHDHLLIAFTFWLVILTWRRANGGG
ncbi:MAG: hypothetical protein AB8G77_03875 [Rhodothermales bacterium]